LRKNIFNIKKLDLCILYTTLIFFILINFIYFYLNLTESIKVSNYAYNELFINYQAGFIRRGLLGEVIWQLNNIFSIDPRIFSTLFFFSIYLAQIFLFIYIFKKYLVSKLIFFTVIFSPSLLLFHIYTPELFFLKDGIIKLVFLIHAFVFYHFIYKNNDRKRYFQYLRFFIIPLLFITILVHEYQVFSLSLHFLISLGSIKEKKEINKIFKNYIPLVIPVIFILFFFGNQLQFDNLSEILKKFDVELNPYLGGGIYHYIGGFYKWHFFYFSYRDFVNLFLSFILSVLIFYMLFNYLLEKKIVFFSSKYQSKYLFFFIPVIIPFLLTSDHGRNLSFLSFYLVTFFIILNLNTKKLTNLIDLISKDHLKKYMLFVFIFFYVFMWKLDQLAGFGLQGKPNDIFQSSLFAEFIKFIKFLYNYIDMNVLDLPEINL